MISTSSGIPHAELVPVGTILDEVRKTTEIYTSDDGYIKGYHLSHQYVGEAITQNRIEEWNCQTPIFIAAQTGTGKSSLVFQKIWTSVKQKNKKLCVCACRTALIQQYKHQAAEVEEPDLLQCLTSLGFAKRHNYGNIDIYSYQELAHLLLKKHTGFFNEYEAVILDECHFFVQDAPFNEFTQEVLESIIAAAQHSIRVYMTATPDVCLDVIIRSEKARLYMAGSAFTRHVENLNLDNFILYYFDANYDYICPCFFKEDNDIIDVIKTDQSSAKYLIFVDSITKGQALSKAIGEDTAEYIDAELKNTSKSEIVDAIISNEKFDKKVLIATSFLDVGVNLKDENLRNIVIYSTDKTFFLQSIGRKRKQKGQPVSLYIHIPTPDAVKKQLKQACYRKWKLEENIRLIHDAKTRFINDLPNSIYVKKIEGKNDIRYNRLAITFDRNRIRELNGLLNELEENVQFAEAFAKHFLKWLGLEHLYRKAHWLGSPPDSANEELIQLIETYAGRDLEKDGEYSQFQQVFTQLYNRLYPQNKIRNGRTPHLKVLNYKLDELKLAYKVKNSGNFKYIITKG